MVFNGHRVVIHDKNNLPNGFKELKDNGWRLPAAPREELSLHQLCMKILGNAFKVYVKLEKSGYQPKRS